MNKRSKIFLFGLLALVLAFGLIVAGCEGPAGPAGSQGPVGGGFNEDEQAFIHANGFAVTLEKLGWTAVSPSGTTVTASAGAPSFPASKTIVIPAGVTFNWTGGPMTVPQGETLTISGGAGSKLSIGTAAMVVLANGADATHKTTLNITVPTGVGVGDDAPVTFSGANTALTLATKTVTLNGAIGPNAALAGLGFTTAPALAQVDLVVEGALTAVTAAATVKSVTVNTGGTLTAAASAIALTATEGITLNGGTIAGNSSGTFDADVRVTKASNISTAHAKFTDGNIITVANGGNLTLTFGITLAGTTSKIIVAEGGTLTTVATNSIIAGGATPAIELSGTLTVVASAAALPAITIKNGGNLAIAGAHTIGGASATPVPTLENGGKITVADSVILTLGAAGASPTLNLSAGGSLVLGDASLVKFTNGASSALGAILLLDTGKSIKGIDGTGELVAADVVGAIAAAAEDIAIPGNIAGIKSSGVFQNISSVSAGVSIGSAPCIKATMSTNLLILTAPATGATISRASKILVGST